MHPIGNFNIVFNCAVGIDNDTAANDGVTIDHRTVHDNSAFSNLDTFVDDRIR
jgi:hypothetical protein